MNGEIENSMIDKITIVVVWYKKNQLDDFLDNINKQKDIDITVISLDNSQNQYVGAREAFNSVINKIDTDYVLFLHPDVYFEDNTILIKMLSVIRKLNKMGVAGVAGCREGKEWSILSNIVHGKNKSSAGDKIKKPEVVQTVDECMFFVQTDIIKKFPFSNINGWHMYAVELCLQLLREGYINYVLPCDIWHKSSGSSLDSSYVLTLEKIVRLYSKDYKYINTTVKQWKTTGLISSLYWKYYFFKQFVKRRI